MKKIQRLKFLIDKINNGEDVSKSSLSRVLSEEQFQQYEKLWVEEILSRKAKKPEVIKIYEKKIKTAILHYSKMERYSFAKGKAALAKKFAHKSESEFGNALEYLQEQFQHDSSLRLWIDRQIDGSNLDPMSVPRVIGSTSFECKDKRKSPHPIMTKRQLKLKFLETALDELISKDLDTSDEVLQPIHLCKTKVIDTSNFKFQFYKKFS
jgi:hypothetical protein